MRKEFICPAGGRTREGIIDGNGQQSIWKCIKCRIDDRGICIGDKIVCCNNYKKNSYDVCLMRGAKFVKVIAKGADETLSVSEVEKIAKEIKYGRA